MYSVLKSTLFNYPENVFITIQVDMTSVRGCVICNTKVLRTVLVF